MKMFLWGILGIGFVLSAACRRFDNPSVDKPAMAEKIRSEFRRTWEGYVRYA